MAFARLIVDEEGQILILLARDDYGCPVMSVIVEVKTIAKSMADEAGEDPATAVAVAREDITFPATPIGIAASNAAFASLTKGKTAMKTHAAKIRKAAAAHYAKMQEEAQKELRSAPSDLNQPIPGGADPEAEDHG